MAYRITTIGSLETEVRRIAGEELRGALRESRRIHAQSDVMHAVRSRCKKLRALLRLVRSGLGKRYRTENHAVRDIARGLSVYRDASVMRTTLDSLLAQEQSLRGADATGRLRAKLTARVEAGIDDGSFGFALAAAQTSLTATAARVDRWRMRGEPMRILAAGLGETYERAHALYGRAQVTRKAHELHEWRKHVKHHLLQLKLIRPLSSKAFPGRMKRMSELSDALGDLHDIDVLDEWLAKQRDPAIVKRARAIRSGIARRRAQLHASAFLLGEPLFARSRREFVDALLKPRGSAKARRKR